MNQIVVPPAAPMTPVPPPLAVAPVSKVVFAGHRSDFRRLVVRGAFLELITVGFYRFWLATDIRRQLWSHTSIDGDAPEYTGTAKELFIGFLFAMAILVPIYVAYTLLGLEAERLQAFASVPLILFFFFFTEFAVYRARRYRLTRTVWRGVRFGMGGSGWNYAARSGGWMLLTILTLGLALPWRQAALERFKMRHTAYGDLKGSFDGKGSELFRRGWWIWLLMWPSAFLLIPLPFLYGAFKAIEWRWWISGLRFGEVHLQSDLDASAMFDLYWKVIGWGLLLATVLSIWLGMAFGLPLMAADIDWSEGEDAVLAALNVVAEPWVLATAAIGYVTAALAFVVILRLYLNHDVWKRVAETTRVHNLAAAANVNVQGQMVGALGEGFADSLDVAGF
jgi:uncharacterized membrane protein YjgN (DUF898 family)